MRGEVTAKTRDISADVTLDKLKGTSAQFTFGGKKIATTLELQGIYNIYNAAAALALARVVTGSRLDEEKLVNALAHVAPAFGRGETLTIGGQPLELVLVKNPSGFRLGLSSFKPQGYKTMIAINDNYADGRDMSWLWDVEFESLKETGVSEVSGIRAYDMALRLQYDEVVVAHVEPDMAAALQHFITSSSGQPKRIFCTYTAMLALRRELSKITNVETVS
jgi:UDP-N-acetylmuramyl tripeptide synthase